MGRKQQIIDFGSGSESFPNLQLLELLRLAQNPEDVLNIAIRNWRYFLGTNDAIYQQGARNFSSIFHLLVELQRPLLQRILKCTCEGGLQVFEDARLWY